MSESPEMRDLFFDEAEEQLARLGDGLLALEREGADGDRLDGVFRAAHTLKGAAGMMGFESTARLLHRMEDLLDRLRGGALSLAPHHVDALFSGLDLARLMVAAHREGRSDDPPALEAALATLEAAAAAPAPPPAAAAPDAFRATEYDLAAAADLARRGMAAHLVRYRVDPAAPMPSVNAFFVLNALKGAGEVIRSVPDEEAMEGDVGPDVAVLVATALSAAEIDALVARTGMTLSRSVEPFVPEVRSLPPDARPEEASEWDGGGPEGLGPSGGVRGGAPPPAPAPSGRGAVLRVDARRVDDCVNLVGELMIALARFQQIETALRRDAEAGEARRHLRDATLRLERVTGELQERTMSLRMVPVAQVFDRFPRVARDLSKSLGKKIELVITGGDTEIDKSVVDDLYEPLLHLVRNAADHALEPPAERVAAGKPAAGRVTLSAAHEGNHALIRVSDDGRGLDLERIRAKAVERGLVGAAEAASLPDREVAAFIFEAGFSTAATVSDLSGRGVGMDAVRNVLERLKGSVDVDTARGRGVTVTLRIPLSLSILPALLVGAAGDTFALPLTAVVELVRVPAADLKSVEGREVALLRDVVTPVVRLDRHFRLRPPAPDPPGARLNVVVVRSGNRAYALVVDAFLGERAIVQKPLDRSIVDSPDVSGASILGDGRVILILDAVRLVARAQGTLRLGEEVA